MRTNPVEFLFVAASVFEEALAHPVAQLHSRMLTERPVMLFLQDPADVFFHPDGSIYSILKKTSLLLGIAVQPIGLVLSLHLVKYCLLDGWGRSLNALGMLYSLDI